MPQYEVYLHLDLLEIIPKGGPQRRKIMDFIRKLGNGPRTSGDFTDKDASLRIRQIKIVGDYAITYWLDDPAKDQRLEVRGRRSEVSIRPLRAGGSTSRKAVGPTPRWVVGFRDQPPSS
jgi:hypothetical protein